MGKNACDDTLHVARKRARDIRYGFSLPKANLVLAEVYTVTSKLVDADAEAHFRAKRRLFEQEGDALTTEGVGECAFLLRPRSSQNEPKFLRRYIGYREKAASV